MHAHERPGRKTPGGARRAAGPEAGAARQSAARVPPLTATVLEAVQRSAGNAAVNRMLSEDESPVQRHAAHEVLRSAGKPLDEPVRTEMEARLGTDFSDVRLHTDEVARRSAAELGARAWTSGNHVVIGNGGGDSHTLAHELAHVVQQRQGPVAGTDNGAGLSVSDPSDRFEREAEATATRVMSRPAAGLPAAQAAPAAPAGAAGPFVQRGLLGFEVEVDKRVKGQGGEKLRGDTDLATSRKADFTVVSDTRKPKNGQAYSNFEFVSGAVQVVGSKASAGPAEIDRIADEMKKVRDEFYKAAEGTTLAEATLELGLEVEPEVKAATLSSQGYTERAGRQGMGDGLYVQYTIGVPLAGIPLMFDRYRAEAPGVDRAPLPRALFRLNQAKPFAEAEVAAFENTPSGKKRRRVDTDSLSGFFQLYFTQVAAVADYLAKNKEKGQIKNQTIFLSRSPLAKVYGLLDSGARKYLSENSEEIVTRLADFQEKTEKEGEKLQFREDSSRKMGDLDEVTLVTYAKSALMGRPEVGQQQVFGGMREISPHPVEGAMVIPLEIRAIGNYYKTWDQLKAELRKIAGWAQEGYEKDREIHGRGGSRR